MDIDLDGTYQVTSTSNYDGPLERKSDGMTVISGGKTSRIDASGIIWNSTFRAISETEVEMVSHADPSRVKAGYALKRTDGTPSLEPITYTTKLKLARKGDRLQMSGQIQYGDEIVFLTMRKINDLS